MFFVGGLGVAWRQLSAAGIDIATSPSSSFFYVFTVAHATHVLGGVIALAAIAVRAPRRISRAAAAGAMSIYWHAINGLWVLLLAFLWLEK